MKKLYLILLLIAISISMFGQDIYFYENFENDSVFDEWSQEYVDETLDWKLNDGGYSTTPGNPGTGDPPYAYQGNNNAYFWFSTLYNEKTKLITPPINLDYAIKPELRFWHAMDKRWFMAADRNEELRIYYKVAADSAWKILETYTVPVSTWTERFINLPDTVLTSNFYIAFEGKNSGGSGLCIDSMSVVETGVIPMYLESLEIKQESEDIVPTESNKNPILRIDFSVQGNDGTLILDSIVVKSLNTDDNDITTNGVKLFASEDSLFRNSSMIGTSQNFSNGLVIFDNLDYKFDRGLTSVWLTYDIKEDINHEMEGHILDAKIETRAIKINNYTYPLIDKSPIGHRTITEALFFDDFETDLGWVLSGEFERTTPQGLGGGIGYSDPEVAYSGLYSIGTDLTGLGSELGDYEDGLADHAYKAISPLINARHFKNVKLIFRRWLNMDGLDHAYVDLSIDGGTSWTNIWNNPSVESDNSWDKFTYNISGYANDKDSVKVQFALGTTDASGVFSGWNIDDVFLTGNFITVDAGIVNVLTPVTSCGHSSTEPIQVVIQNYAGEATDDTIPVYYSIDGGVTKYYDSLYVSIPVDEIDTLTLNKTIDLTTPGEYSLIVSTDLPGDEITSNDSYTKSFYAIPTLTLPYSQNLETNNGHWRSLGLGNWDYGQPTTGDINNAASGEYAWVTHLNTDYSNSDSSILEGPCFDFTGVNNPVFEFKLKNYTKVNDGMALFYSTDNGVSWDIVPETSEYYWKWYNESLIGALGTAGWGDTTTTDWYTVRKLLPAVIANEASVKFRFLFRSNEDGLVDAGIGIDDIKIYDAPYDVGVTLLEYPFDKCEWNDTTHVKVHIENYSISPVKVGTKIPLKLNFNSEIAFDTLTIASELAIDDSVLFTFNSTVDMSYKGDYDFFINTDLESNTYFYNDTVSNDTLYSTVSVTGMPNYDIGWIVGSEDLDTLLDAGVGYASYFWDGPVEDSTTQTYRASSAGIYYVTVTNGIGCTANDSLKVVPSQIDVKMDSIRTVLEDSCQRFELTEIKAAIANLGQILEIGDTIPFGYQVNNLSPVLDTLTLLSQITTTHPNDTVTFTFADKCDLTETGEYTISVFTNFASDLNRNNDTITVTINTWGLPDVELAYDTIYSSQADTLTLDAGSGFATYNWNSGSSVQTETPSNSSYYYKVTVTDVHACSSDKDSTYIETHDLGISAVTSPVNVCEDLASATTALSVEVTNYSDSVYSSSSVKIFYEYDGGLPIEVNPVLNVGASSTVILNNISTVDATSVGEHTLKIYSSSDIDANHTNDTLEYTFETWPLPEVDLPYDTIFTTKADTVLLIAQEGFASYSWNTGSTNDTLTVSKKYSEKYIVTVTDENGCGSDSDSTQIITYNIGLMKLNAPISSCTHTATEPVKITVKNYSQDTILSGEVIDLYYKLDDNSPVHEQKTLTDKFYPSNTFTHEFSQTVDLSAINTYIISTYAIYEKDVYNLNDTLKEGIGTYSSPSIYIGEDVLTTQPDTVILVAPEGYIKYEWDDGTKDDSLEVIYPATREYSVTVTDLNGCSATDQIYVYTYDVAASSLLTPFSQCELSNSETVNFNIVNSSQDTLLIGETIDVRYIVNSGSLISESFNLADTLFPAEVINYSFTQQADLSVNQVHELKVFAKLSSVDVELDDTITSNVDYQKPEFNLGADVNTENAQHTIDAGAGYTSYLWFDASTNQTYVVDINDQNPSHIYAVTVTNSYGCSAEDSIEVTFTITPDLAVTNMVTPISDCWNESETYPVHIVITNSGVVNLNSGGNFIVGYIIDGGTAVTETFNLLTAMNASDTREHTFTDEISFASAKVYEFKTFVKLADDGTVSNDTLTTNIDISAPEVNLGANDTIYFVDSYEISTSESYVSYLWSDGSTGSTLTVTETNTYSVTVTDEYGCQGEGSIYCEKYTGIENIIQGDGYHITYYPNPVSEKLMIQFDNRKSTDVIIEIVSSNGQILYNNKLTDIENTIERIDVNPYANGIYFLRFRIDDDFYIRKIIIQ